MSRTWPLVGRDEELRVAGRTLGSRDGRSGVMLSGAAGVGKTRLARELVARLAVGGRVVRWALATESAREMPLAAFGWLLDGSAAASIDPLDRAVESLHGGLDRGVVIGVDDAHLLDDASAVLVHRLVTRRLATVVLTVRDGEQPPHAIASLSKDGHLSRLAVRSLSAAHTHELLERVLDGPLDSAATRRFWMLAHGNALFLRHLVDGELAAGRLSQVDGVWCWPGAPEITGELAEIVGRQMGDLPSGVRDVVDVLALAEPLGLATVQSLIGSSDLEAAESRGLVRVDGEGRGVEVRLTHPMYGEVRRAELGTLRARRLRGLIANTLVATGEAAGDTVRRAVLILDSDLPPDSRLFLEAAQRAISMVDLELATRLAVAAAEAGGGFEAELVLAYAHGWSGRGDEAESILSRLMREADTPLDRARAAAPLIGDLFWTLNRPDAAAAVLEEALAEVVDDELGVRLRAMRVAMDMALGRVEEAIAGGTRLLATGTPADQSVVMAAGAVAGAAAVAGRIDTMRWGAERAYQAAARSFDAVVPRFSVADWHILGLRLAGLGHDAALVADQVERDTDGLPGRARLMALVLTGHVALAEGRVASALRTLREARAASDGVAHEFTYRGQVLLAHALALAGQTTQARRVLAEVEGEDRASYRFMDPDRLLVRAWVAANDGATSEAIAIAQDAASLARDRRAAAYEVVALQTMVQLGDPSRVARLDELAAVVEGPRAVTAASHARALGAQNGDALSRVSERWGEIGDLLAAADAGAQAAVAYRHVGRNGSAATAAARAHHLATERCEGAFTPALAAAARPLPLTTREREIATLAARGLSNKEIAERLTVSVRTVEGHLYRAGQKLGVHERSELLGVLAVE